MAENDPGSTPMDTTSYFERPDADYAVAAILIDLTLFGMVVGER